jgi:hypothetical protein
VVEFRRRAAVALRSVVACILLASCHTPTITYKAPPSATPANSATIVGTVYSRNAFNSIYNCLDAIDGVGMGTGVFLCKHLARESLLVAPGHHSLLLSFQWESGQFTSGSSKSVSVELAAGQTYTIRSEQLDDPEPGKTHKVAIWLQDSAGAILGGRQELTFDDPDDLASKQYASMHPAEENVIYPMSQHNLKPLDPIGLPEITRLFLYTDFGNQSQSFERSFNERFKSLAAACHVEVTMISVPHATRLTLNPAKMPPDGEMQRQAAGDGASHLLKVLVREWAGPHAPPADLSSSFDDGGFNIDVSLLPASSGAELWHPPYFYASVAKGGGVFAEKLARALDKHGALPNCPKAAPGGVK